jgi:hypothetical protein
MRVSKTHAEAQREVKRLRAQGWFYRLLRRGEIRRAEEALREARAEARDGRGMLGGASAVAEAGRRGRRACAAGTHGSRGGREGRGGAAAATATRPGAGPRAVTGSAWLGDLKAGTLIDAINRRFAEVSHAVAYQQQPNTYGPMAKH